MSPVQPDGFSVLRVILAFLVVFSLIGLLGFGLKYISVRGIKMPGTSGKSRRLELVESLPLDVRRRLVIVRCDNKEHLLLLGSNQEIVVATDIEPERNAP